jgi:hypothetical protein
MSLIQWQCTPALSPYEGERENRRPPLGKICSQPANKFNFSSTNRHELTELGRILRGLEEAYLEHHKGCVCPMCSRFTEVLDRLGKV